jgi:hypothetical protein
VYNICIQRIVLFFFLLFPPGLSAEHWDYYTGNGYIAVNGDHKFVVYMYNALANLDAIFNYYGGGVILYFSQDDYNEYGSFNWSEFMRVQGIISINQTNSEKYDALIVGKKYVYINYPDTAKYYTEGEQGIVADYCRN